MAEETILTHELNSCVDGEIVKIPFSGESEVYVAVLTEQQYQDYLDGKEVKCRTLTKSPAYFKIKGDGDRIVTIDLDGKSIKSINPGIVIRYSPLLTMSEIKNLTADIGTTYVANAHDSTLDDSMIQYWKDHQRKFSKIDLSQPTFRCPSCGQRVNTDTLNGAHVVKIKGAGDKQYITPTCEHCNKTKTDRIFKVSVWDLVDAPEE